MKIHYYVSKWLICLVFLLSGTILKAQDIGGIKGFVYDDANGEAISYVSVVLKGTSYSTTTDELGFFSITRIPAGNYTVVIGMLGYETYTKNITIRAGETQNVRAQLKEAVLVIDGAEINAERQEAREEVKISQVKMTAETIKRMPSVGGTPDFAQALQLIGGAVSTGDRGGQLYIRGGPPVQNKVMLDGMIIYNPFHSIGLFSVFDTDIIRNADIYTGGFGAQYGGRISSVMDITTRDGNKKRFGGKVTFNTFTAGALLEGPFAKLREDRAVSASFLLSAKGSFLEHSSKVFYPYADSNGLPYNFWDIYGKVSIFADKNGSKVNLFGFSYNDQVNFNTISKLNWQSFGGGANFIVVPGVSNVRIDGVFSYSSYRINLSEESAPPRSSLVNGFNFGINFQQAIGISKLFYGLEALGYTTDFRFVNAQQREIYQTENTTEFAAFVRFKANKWGFVFDPSFRIHYYASLNNISLEPRLAVKYNVVEWFRIKLAGGLYSQNLIAANSDRDVVNLFYGFLSGSDNIPKKYQGNDVNHKLQKSQHAIFGLEFNAGKYVTINAEGYYINFSQLLNLNRTKTYDDNGANANIPDELKKDFIIETGYAAGADFTVTLAWKDLYFYTVYSYMKTERTDEVTTYSPHFAREHNINVLASYKFGKKKGWEVSARWNFGSGFPFTQTQGFYEFLDFQGGINTDYTTGNGDLGIIYGEVNQGRLPYYHRFDVNIRKTFEFKKNLKLEINAGATNIYNRENIFYIDRVTYNRINQLPIMPTVGVNFEF